MSTETKLASKDQDCLYRHCTTWDIFTPKKVRRKSNFVQVGAEYENCQHSTYEYEKDLELKSKLQHNGTWPYLTGLLPDEWNLMFVQNLKIEETVRKCL